MCDFRVSISLSQLTGKENKWNLCNPPRCFDYGNFRGLLNNLHVNLQNIITLHVFLSCIHCGRVLPPFCHLHVDHAWVVSRAARQYLARFRENNPPNFHGWLACNHLFVNRRVPMVMPSLNVVLSRGSVRFLWDSESAQGACTRHISLRQWYDVPYTGSHGLVLCEFRAVDHVVWCYVNQVSRSWGLVFCESPALDHVLWWLVDHVLWIMWSGFFG